MSISMQQPARRSSPCDLGGRCQHSDQGLLWSCPGRSASLEFSAGAPLPALSPSWQFNTVYCADYLESHWCNKHPCRLCLRGARWDQVERACPKERRAGVLKPPCSWFAATESEPLSSEAWDTRTHEGFTLFTCGLSPFRKFQVLVWVNRINRMQMKRLLKC